MEAVVLQELSEKNLLKGTMRAKGLESDLELQLELKRLELEEKREPREYAEREAERQRQFELQKVREETEFRLREMERKIQFSEQEGEVLKKYQIGRSMSLVPKFDEREVEKYFLMFEIVAESIEWPRKTYCLFLQSVLTGKANYVYCALSSAQCAAMG